MRLHLRPLLYAFVPLLVLGCGGGAPGPRSAVLFTLDTTRADALGCLGGDGATPHLDGLAESSLVFTNARTVAPITLPAHASMLTGLYPPRHTVRTNAFTALPESAVTLAERAREGGFETAAFLAAVVLDRPFGLAQGFDVYDLPPPAAPGSKVHMAERPDAAVARAAVRWLEERDSTRPFFLWVHFFGPHAPYEPPPAFRPRAPGNRAAYLGEVAAMDDAFGRVLAALDLDSTTVAVVGDHGEGLGDHGEETHSILVYEPLLRVPFFVHRPGGADAARHDAPVSVVDVFPTLLAELGLGSPGDVDGLALTTIGGPPASRGVYFESYDGYLNYGWSPIAGWLEGGRKFLHGTSPELYDLDSDAGERTNIYVDEASALPHLDALAAIEARPPLEGGGRAGVGGELQADIQALGYAATSSVATPIPRLLENTRLPDPRTRLDELNAFHAAVLDYQAGLERRDPAKVERALDQLAAIADRNPHNSYANGALGSFLYRQGRAAEALNRLLTIPEERRDHPNIQDTLGHCFEQLKRPQEALPRFLRSLELRPGDPHALGDVIRVLESLGRSAEAAPFRRLLQQSR